MTPLAWALRGKAGPRSGAARDERLRDAVKRAFGDQSYVLLNLGSSTWRPTSFYHDPPAASGLLLRAAAGGRGAWSIVVIGLFNIFGSLGAGWAMGRWRSKSLLAALYAGRALAIRGVHRHAESSSRFSCSPR